MSNETEIPSEEIIPYLVYRILGEEMECALWRLAEGHTALALFLSEETAKAYQIAKEQISVNKLAAYLRKLNYTYPFHQAVGYYLERAGYRPSQVALMDQFDSEFDFYITYGMKAKDYIERWKLFVPKGF